MAFVLPSVQPSLLAQSKSTEKSLPQTFSPLTPISQFPTSSTFSCSMSTLQTPPGVQDKQQHQHPKDEFYVNLGLAVRTLREDLPLIFIKDLNYDIYRDDITFMDPLNTFSGIEKYKLILWALRFHGKVLFREIALDVLRVWQPSENVILVRWKIRGVPRVPWEAKGEFQGTSRYKLDRNGKIYEHKIDNLAFNFPKSKDYQTSFSSGLCYFIMPCNSKSYIFVGSCGFILFFMVIFIQAVRETLDQESNLLPQDVLATFIAV